MATIQDIFSSGDRFIITQLPFADVHKQALTHAAKIVGTTKVYFEAASPDKNLIKSISTSVDKGHHISIETFRDGQILVEGWVRPNSRTIHLISMREGKPVIEDVTKTFNRVCGDSFLDEKKGVLLDSKSASLSQAGATAQYQPIEIDPTTPKPNQAQLAAGAVISDRKPIDEASIQMHQGQSSGSPDCGGGCNSKGCTIM